MKPLTCARALVAVVSFLVLERSAAVEPLVSPEVRPDRRVTLRVRAPKASEVGVWGDWMPANTLAPAARDLNGDWSVTVGPLEPGVAIYTVTVDGVTTPDPVNPRVKLRARTSASLVAVPGEPPEWWEARDVPHGALAVHWERSAVLGDTRAFIVYRPPGFDPRRSPNLPVLYLLHGSNDTAAGWTDVGKANFILDNLIAAHRARPMVVVMPWGHAVPYDGPQNRNTALFERYLLDEVMPFVERTYRTAADRRRRAIVGLSMGGGQALQIAFGHPDLFGAVGAFSSAIPGDFEDRFRPVLGAPEVVNRKLELVWIGCGRQDPAFDGNQAFAAMLSARGVHATFAASEGRHNFAFWRRCLVDVAPRLFPPRRGG